MRYRVVLALLLLTGATPLWPQGCDCRIQFKQGNGAAVDGSIDTIQEWSDAAVLDTAVDTSCLRELYDWTGAGDPAVNNTPRQVQVWSKSDGTNLWLAFRVHDATRNASGGGSLALGERILVQIDPDGSRGAQLGTGAGALQKDYRFEIAHKWGAGGGGQIAPSESRYYESTLPPPGNGCNTQDWEEKAMPGGVQFALQPFGAGITGGYMLELKIPLSVVGRTDIVNPGTAQNMGVSFGIINDVGSPNFDAFGVSFPSSLPMSNATGPLVSSDLGICSGWLVPNAWSTAFFGVVAPSVEILRNPVWWSSASVNAFDCAAEVTTYLYRRTKACKLRVDARIENTGNTAAARNILVLWGQHGAGQTVWKFVDIQKNASIPAGGATVHSALWNDVPSGQAGHPCIRVYVLPAAFQPAFDENAMRNITTSAQVDQLEQVYGIAEKCLAQKNISALENTSCTTCPSTAGLRLDSPFLLYAQEYQPPARIFLSDQEAKQFGNHILVQIETFGVARKRSNRRTYNFIEPVAGAIEMFTVEQAKKNPVLPINMVIGNPGAVERRIFVKPSTRAPAGAPQFRLGLDFDAKGVVMRPNEQRTITGPTGRRGCFSCFRLGTTGTAMLLFGLTLLGWRRRRS